MSSLRTTGILLHPTSLPGPHGIGDLGRGARAFVDWLGQAGCGLWQTLPVVLPGAGNSPYSSLSALSGNTWLIDLEELIELGLLDASEVRPPTFTLDAVDYAAVEAFKGPLLAAAADRLLAGADETLARELAAFRSTATWAEGTAFFVAYKASQALRPWWEWPAGVRDREPAALRAASEELATAIDREVALQFLFARQWKALKALCAERGIRIMGDVPIYVDTDSVDVWSERASFQLEPDGRPRAVAGVPPDYFSETGQMWGNPLFDWEHLAANGHAFWVRRLERSLELFDLVRIDHFRGFAAYWSIPAGAEDARAGAWVQGPGMALFVDLKEALGELPLIAEDLGTIDADVKQLLVGSGLPGMRVLHFAFGSEADHAYLPHSYVPDTVVYTGTHDNDTTLGWWQTAGGHIQDHVRRYLMIDGGDVVWDLIRAAVSSVARTAIVPMQDVLTLDGGARMNTPGVAEGNWRWRVRREGFDAGLAARLKYLNELYARSP